MIASAHSGQQQQQLSSSVAGNDTAILCISGHKPKGYLVCLFFCSFVCSDVKHGQTFEAKAEAEDNFLSP